MVCAGLKPIARGKNKPLPPRFQMPSIPVVFLACKVFEGLLRQAEHVQTTFMDYGLHSVPRKLNTSLQEKIDSITEPSLIVLGYGLCGNGIKDLHAGKHTLIVPKADDCITIFLGSRQRYLSQFSNDPGTYFLTKGWFEVGSDPLTEYEAMLEKYGQKVADRIMEAQYRHYRRLLFVANSESDLAAYRPRALEVAGYCERFGMRYEEKIGSDDFLKKINDVLQSHSTVPQEFIVIPPGGTIQQEMFR